MQAWRQAGNISAPVTASAGGEIAPGVWQGESYANSSDTLMVARLDIPNEDYNRLHMRAIDVSVQGSSKGVQFGRARALDSTLLPKFCETL